MALLKCIMVVVGWVCKINWDKSNRMKQRILTGWNFIRVIYVLLGCFIIIQSAADRQWFGIIFGGYFAAMGLFAVGCAGGACFGSSCYYPSAPKKKNDIAEAEFEEVK